MTNVHRTAIMPFTAAQMFDLVDEIEHYPEFLPWCRSTQILARTADSVQASIEISRMGIHKSFTTRNDNQRPTQITLHFINGPFKQLDGYWRFEKLGEGCKVILNIDYEMTGGFLDKAFGSVFHGIANSLVDAFCERAKVVYG